MLALTELASGQLREQTLIKLDKVSGWPQNQIKRKFMIKSMTAFSSSEIRQDDIVLSWEIRSVNHRYLDISLYMPEGFNSLENDFKEILRKKLGRGKVDAKLVCKNIASSQQGEIKINEALVKNLLDTKYKLEKLTKKSMSFSSMDILQWPGVMDDTQSDFSAYKKPAKSLFIDAIDELIKTREEEGGRLSKLLLSRAKAITKIVKSVRKRRIEVMSALREKVLKKLSELDVSADENRLEQELVYQAQRLDVDEELDRLDSHIDELIAVLERDEPIGRRLDFLMQELNREANTLASKSNDAETTKAAVELKVLIEQMREQVMNIE
jgi:uncharacterized protein (TIGR00255 family)